VYYDVFLTTDLNWKPNETFHIGPVITKANNLTFGAVRLESNLVHWDMKYYHWTNYPCAEGIGM